MPLDKTRLRKRLAKSQRDRNGSRRKSRDALPVERARRIPILDVARMLGLGTPEPEGSEWVVRCPFHHDENPSLMLNKARGVWFCWPCGRGGDGIALFKQARGLSFVEAVLQMTGQDR